MRVLLLILFLTSVSHGIPVSELRVRLRGGQGSTLPAREKVCLVGSGNWGCAIARIVGDNVATARPDDDTQFDKEVRMWVFEEEVDGQKLTDIINTRHENVKYLPGYALPPNVVAVPDLAAAVADATILIFVLPHQFLGRLLPVVKENMMSGAIAVSLIKGMECGAKGLELISEKIRGGLGGVATSVLMGANVADEVARGDFCEATLGCVSEEEGRRLVRVLDQPGGAFRVQRVPEVGPVELCGALKNVVALAAGFADGLGLGGNSKAALVRVGLKEMLRCGQEVLGGMAAGTLLESCGVADVVTSCYGGRNRRVAAAFAQANGTRSWQELEGELLGGQKLQGTSTVLSLHQVLEQAGLTHCFPFFETIHQIVVGSLEPRAILDRTSSYY